jgi:septal ring factor EnvC (AmiA/AmiB activator)
MKKTLISNILAGVLLAGISTTSVMAADTTTITKATVKLIKNQREIKEEINELKKALKRANIDISKTKKHAGKIDKKAKKALNTLSDYKKTIRKNEKDIKELKKRLTSLERKVKANEKQTRINAEKIRTYEKATNERINSMKRVFNSELKVIKAKLNGKNSEYIVDKKREHNSYSIYKCQKQISTKVEHDIDNFIK